MSFFVHLGLHCCNLKVFVRKTERMIYPEAALLWSCSLNFEYYAGALQSCVQNIISFILRPPSRPTGQWNIFQESSAQHWLLFRNKQSELCQNQWTRTAVSPSHLPIFSQNLIIFPRSASHFLSIALKELQGQDGRELISRSYINDKDIND